MEQAAAVSSCRRGKQGSGSLKGHVQGHQILGLWSNCSDSVSIYPHLKPAAHLPKCHITFPSCKLDLCALLP